MGKSIIEKFFTVAFLFCLLGVLFSQTEDQLERGKKLYKKGNYIEAVKVLEAYNRSIEGNSSQSKNYAEAYYLLAKIYYEAGEDKRVEEYLKKAFLTDRAVGQDEPDKAFKKRVDKLRAALPVLINGSRAGEVKTIAVNSVDFEFVWIPAGEFMMGSPSWDEDRLLDEMPQHKVTISKSFWLGKLEVTQGQWQALTGNNPSIYKNAGQNAPIDNVSWNDSQEYIQLLSAKTGLKFRLPTEAEWEYACRAGSTNAIYTGNLRILGEKNAPDLDPIAWYGGNSGVDYEGGLDSSEWKGKQYNHQKAGPHLVGKKQPNTWGLHDMLGNVWEWCQDGYGPYSAESQVDPLNSSGLDWRMYRGGSWIDDARKVRTAYRDKSGPDYGHVNIGLRLAADHLK